MKLRKEIKGVLRSYEEIVVAYFYGSSVERAKAGVV